MNVSSIKSYAKINLALNVIGKLDLLHKIESIISFITLHDLIFIKKINSSNSQVSFYGKFSKNISKNNTIVKLLKILEKKNLLQNKKFQIKVQKNIPQKAGLGGGSMNAANILNFLIKKKFIKINKKKLQKICYLIGSDVVLGINSVSTILKANKDIKKFKNCSKFYTLLVRPNFGCSTKNIYSGVKKLTKPKFNNPKKLCLDLVFCQNRRMH